VRGEARRVVSGRAVSEAQSTAQHSTTQLTQHQQAQAQAHRNESFIHQILFACRARTRATPAQSRAEQSRAHPFSRVGARGDLRITPHRQLHRRGPICRETKTSRR